MGSQRFCLRWNNHQSNLLSVFDQLLHDESFVDVTLAVEGQFLRAHKMVLSACSPYFQALFVGHPDKHPIVILKDVPYSDMRSLLDFMYRGEVSVDQDRLTAFLKVAESLRIKGLTEVNEERCDLPSIANSLLSQTPPPAPQPPSTTPQPQPPNLHRIQIPQVKRHLPNPMLNSALTAPPKRKRGRPRKLSGSSPGTPNPSNNENELEEIKQNNIEPLGASTPNSLPPSVGMESNLNNNESESHEGVKKEDGDEVMEVTPPPSTTPVPISTQTDPADPKLEPTPGTSTQDSIHSFQSNTTDGERFSTSELFLPTVSVSICEDVSITPTGRDGYTPETEVAQDDVVITPISENPNVQFAPHFLSHESLILVKEEPPDGVLRGSCGEEDEESGGMTTAPPARRDLLEYLINKDGSVVCKWCGELLPSRTHWYRHKYKFHISTPPPGTASLFKCYRCNVFFKSRKGYLGHVSTRHSVEQKVVIEELKPCGRRGGRRTSEDFQGSPEEYEKQREKEEKLVADIIDRVKRECEAQGSTVSRKGYSRRSTVMNT